MTMCGAVGQRQRPTAALGIRACMNLRVASATRAADCRILFSTFRPESARCPLARVELILCLSCARRRWANSLDSRPYSLRSPRREAIIDRAVESMLRRTVTPAAIGLQHIHYAAVDAAILRSRASRRRGQARYYRNKDPISRWMFCTTRTKTTGGRT